MKVRIKSRESIMELDSTVAVQSSGSFSCNRPSMTFVREMFYLFGEVVEVKKKGDEPFYTVEKKDKTGFWCLVEDWFVVIPKPKLSYSKGDKYAE